jgi:hypothetical protein
MMAKEQKTAHELEALIREQSKGMNFNSLEVRPEQTYGWAAYVTHDRFPGEYQAHVDRVSHQLRANYDLRVDVVERRPG